MAENDGNGGDNDWQRTLEQRERDLVEMQNEIAGRGHSRIRRFLPDDHASNPAAQAKKKRQERAYRSALRALLKNESYRALYEETFDKLRSYEAATERALEQAREDVTEAKDALDEMRERASTSPDGTRVFRDKNGDVYSEDGELISGAALESIEWCADAPSYEDFVAQKKATAEAEGRVNDLLIYQTDVLGHARDRLTDEDNPPTKQELEAIQESIEREMPAGLRTERTVEDSDHAPSQATSNIGLPQLNS